MSRARIKSPAIPDSLQPVIFSPTSTAMSSNVPAVSESSAVPLNSRNPPNGLRALHIPIHPDPDPHPSLKTPKTPADEAIDFFESAIVPGQAPIRVYELVLDDDGGPNKDRSVRYPPSALLLPLTPTSTSDYHLPIHHIFFASRSMPDHLPLRMVSSRQTSLSMEVSSIEST